MKILVVEDERDLNNVITKYLKKHNFSVDSAFNGTEALEFIAVSEYDVILMDIMMPKVDGLTVLKTIREEKNSTPVLILTAKDSLEDKVDGLNLGGDDYLVKPFEFEELIARINALIRRNYGNKTSTLEVNGLKIDTGAKTVFLDEKFIELTGKEYAVLEYLVQNKNKVISRSQIREHAWDFDYEGESNIIDVLIKNIRRKLDANDSNRVIQTKRGLGYVIREK